jgi:hypothetical protein
MLDFARGRQTEPFFGSLVGFHFWHSEIPSLICGNRLQ